MLPPVISYCRKWLPNVVMWSEFSDCISEVTSHANRHEVYEGYIALASSQMNGGHPNNNIHAFY